MIWQRFNCQIRSFSKNQTMPMISSHEFQRPLVWSESRKNNRGLQRCFKLYCAYSISFNSSNVCEFFLDLHSRRLYWSLGKEKGSRCLVFSSYYKTWNKALSRRSRAAMPKIRMKKKRRYKRANLFFGLLDLKPIIFCRSRFRSCRLPTARPYLLLQSPNSHPLA